MTPEELKTHRQALGYTQQKLAEELGISRRLLGGMERGDMPISTIASLAIERLVSKLSTNISPVIFLDGKEVSPWSLPNGPLFIVWGPNGKEPIRYVFTQLEWAQKAAKNMAERYANSAQMFYVAALIYGYQQQVEMAEFPMKLRIV